MDRIEERIFHQAEFVQNLTWEMLPEEVKERARWVILDSLGCILKGLGEKQLSGNITEDVLDVTTGMVSTELYEGNKKAIGHPACHILPVMLTDKKNREIPWKEFIRIFIAAYEVASRFGAAIRFSHTVLGHGTVMSSGALVAEALTEKTSTKDLYEALLLMASLPEVSVWQAVFDGSGLHDAYAGLAALKARDVLYMEKQGIRSSGKIIESVYQDIMTAHIEPEKLNFMLGEEYWLCSNYFKIHTGCRFIHPFADLLRTELNNGLKKEEVEQIHVYTYKKAARLTDQKVPNDLAAKFSIPVALAVQLEKGSLTPDTIRNCQRDRSVCQWEGHIWLHEDEKYNKLLPDVRGGRMEISLKNGKKIVKEVFHAIGDYDNPHSFTREDLIYKFKENTGKFAPDLQEKIISNVLTEESEEWDVQNVLAEFYTKVYH